MGISKFSSLSIAAAVSLAIAGCAATDNNESSVSLSGIVADGYLQNATVCLDLNENKACDTGEPTATTDEVGAYRFTAKSGDSKNFPVISVITAGVTTDADDTSRILKAYVMSAPAGKPEWISPVTTMIQTEIESNPGMTVDAAESSVKSTLGYGASENVDLFNDYIATQKNGSADDVKKYKRIHRIAQVTARALEANHTAIAEAATAAGLDKDEALNELVRLVVKQVIADMDKITAIVDATALTDSFDPDTTANTPSIVIDKSDLENAVLTERVATEAARGNIVTILQAGMHILSSDFNTSVSDSEFDYRTIKLSSNNTIDVTTTTWDGTAWVIPSATNTDTGTANTEYKQMLTSNGLTLFDKETVTEKLIDNGDGTANIVITDTEGNIVNQFKIQGAEVSLAGRFIRPTLNLRSDENIAWKKALPANAIFEENAKGYRWSVSSTADTYRIRYRDASATNANCTEIGDTTIDTSKNCNALSDAGIPIAVQSLSDLTDGTKTFSIDDTSFTVTLTTDATDSSGKTGIITFADLNGTSTETGKYEIKTPLGGTTEVLVFDVPFRLRQGLRLDNSENLFVVIDEGYARLGTISLGGVTEKDNAVYYNEAALNSAKNCFKGGTNTNGSGSCSVGLFLKNGAIADGAVISRITKTMIPFVASDLSGTTRSFTNTKLDGTTRQWDFVFNTDGTATWTSSSLTLSGLTWKVTDNGRLKIERPSNGDKWVATQLDDDTMHVRRKRIDAFGVLKKNFGAFMTDSNTSPTN